MQVYTISFNLVHKPYYFVIIIEPHEAPTNVDVEVEGSTKATMSWQPPPFEHQNGPIDHYSLIISDTYFGLGDIHIITSNLTYTVTGLEEFNSYSFVVAAATIVDIGPYSSPINFTTFEDGMLPKMFCMLMFHVCVELLFQCQVHLLPMSLDMLCLQHLLCSHG